MTFAIPTLETERLRLRAVGAADLPAYVAMWQQPAFYQHLGGQPVSRPDAWTKLLRCLGLWAAVGYGYWGVEEKTGGAFVGLVGFAEQERDIVPALRGFPEVGWTLAPRVHGRGYGTEATRAALAWADAHLPECRSVCLIDVGNAASLRLAARLGYREFSQTTYKGTAVLLLERVAPAGL